MLIVSPSYPAFPTRGKVSIEWHEMAWVRRQKRWILGKKDKALDP